MTYKDKKEVMDKAEIEQELIRISHEIIERNKEIENLVLVGIRTRGIYIARRIATFIHQIKEIDIPVGVLDITLYRDDLRSNSDQPIIHKTDIPFSIMDRGVILVDDVLYTGRTTRAALDGLMSVGRPEFIRLAVLIDRGHRELPIQADYIGRNISTSKDEMIRVMLEEEEAIDRVLLQKRATL